MNQSILFSDAQEWHSEQQCICFPAQQCGALINCIVSAEYLSQLSGEVVNTESQAIAIFEQYRFDLEERAEELIEDEKFDATGNITLG